MNIRSTSLLAIALLAASPLVAAEESKPVEGVMLVGGKTYQLKYAVAELSTHENQRVTKALNDGLQAALTGTKQPGPALRDAQAEATRILRAYKR